MNDILTNDERDILLRFAKDSTSGASQHKLDSLGHLTREYRMDSLIRKGFAEWRKTATRRWDIFLTEEGKKIATVLEVMES